MLAYAYTGDLSFRGEKKERQLETHAAFAEFGEFPRKIRVC